LSIDLKVADIAFGGATYPVIYGREIKMLVNRHTGLRFTDTLMQEFGHAVHYSLIDEPSFLLKSGYSEAFDEGAGQGDGSPAVPAGCLDELLRAEP
jgi:hypothetical protein